ncbi:acetate kinase [Rhizoctonia solani 123E]|uniref:Probable acetate kinase n=1 Tax=Rhizoctonia solani 123E TaxID=1423351 RepID=A0A074S3V5_9AGAM|nr:acetate kinase [Rhizoctonia solani 123E]
MSTEMLLAVNCGSSSIKFKLYTLSDLDVLISGTASNVEVKGEKPSIKYTVYESGKDDDEKVSEEEKEGMPYEDVFERVITLIEGSSSKHFVKSEDSNSKPRVRDLVKVVAHRVVHGGTEAEPMAIWPGHEQGLEEMDALSAFAPLHNHFAVQVVRFCLKHIPNGRQILLFDTMFHSTIPPHIYTYPLGPSSEKTAIPLRKYGAHGLSYSSILDSVSSYLDKPKEQCTFVVAHLGSGASVCLVKEGKSWDTSMGLTPLDGLPGGTRTGSVDPVLVFHHTPNASSGVEIPGGHCARAEIVLNKQGGLQALAGTSNFGHITSTMEESKGGDEQNKAQLAYDVFLDRLMNYVGAYVVKAKGLSSGLDGIVFSGGIGEKSVRLRADVGRMFSWMGCKVDQAANEAVGNDKQTVTEITGKDSNLRILVCLTDEETQCARMAKHAYESNEMK